MGNIPQLINRQKSAILQFGFEFAVKRLDIIMLSRGFQAQYITSQHHFEQKTT